MPYCQITDPFAEVYANNQLLVRFTDPPIDYSINQFLFSQTLTWDGNQSVTKFSPETISYTIQNVPGQAYSLSWNNGSHILNNPSNYSYSFIEDYMGVNCTLQYTVREFATLISNNQVTQIGEYYPFGKGFELGRTTTNPNQFGYFLRINWSCSNVRSQSQIYPSFPGAFKDLRVEVFRGTTRINPAYKIRIIDGGTAFEYPINDRNSVVVNYTVAGKRIVVNGVTYNLINENSITLTEAQKYRLTINSQSQQIKQDYNSPPSVDIVCGESCPPDTCKVECSDHYCCYNSLGNVVKVFPK